MQHCTCSVTDTQRLQYHYYLGYKIYSCDCTGSSSSITSIVATTATSFHLVVEFSFGCTNSRSQVRGVVMWTKVGSFWLIWLIYLICYRHTAPQHGSEGSHLTMEVGRSIFSMEKQHGQWPGRSCDSVGEKKHVSKVVKRSFQRAQKRAQTQGMAWYKGRWITPHNYSDTTHTVHKQKQTQLPRPNKGPQISVMTWNVGGLSLEGWDAFLHWLQQQPEISIVCLQETHWQHTSKWLASQYICIHSTLSKKRSGGVMTLVARSLASQDAISWREIAPGRILHFRIYGHDPSCHHTDIVNVYQHHWSHEHKSARRSLGCFALNIG